MALDLIGFSPLDVSFTPPESKIMFETGERTLGAVGEGGEVISTSRRFKTIVREDTGDIVGVVGTKYSRLRNQDFFGTIERALRDTIPEEMREGAMYRDSYSGGGSWSKREYVLPAYAEALRSTEFETKVGLRIIAWNSYDGSASAGLLTGLIDFFCTNGMIIGRSIETQLRRHSARLTPDLFVPSLREGIENIHGTTETLQKMMQTKLDKDAALLLLESNFSAKRAAEIYRRMEAEIAVRGNSVFALHSALTFYSSHNSDQFTTRAANDDLVARMLRDREEEVTKILRSRAWSALMAA